MNPFRFGRAVVMAHDSRYPEHPERVAALIRSLGLTDDPTIYLNGHGRPDLDRAAYAMVHEGSPPLGWMHSAGHWFYNLAYRAAVKQALDDGVQTLLICEDDIEASPSFAAILARAVVPADWQLLYFHTFRFWETAACESAGPYLIRLNGGQCGSQAVAWRPEAMRRFLELPIDRPVDWAKAGLHHDLPAYAIEPSVIRHADGIASTVGA